MVRVSVPIPGHPYDVTVGSGVLAAAGAHLPPLPKAERAFVVADATAAERYHDPLAAGLAAAGLEPVLLTVPSGEEAKTLQVYGTLLHQLASQEAHRDDLVVALGGGSTGDLAGFVASTYMRGRALRPGAHDAHRAGRRVDRREDRREPSRGEEPRGDLLAAASGARRRGHPGVADGQRLPLGTRRGREVRPDLGPRAAGPVRDRPRTRPRAGRGGAGDAGGAMRVGRRPARSPRTSRTPVRASS